MQRTGIINQIKKSSITFNLFSVLFSLERSTADSWFSLLNTIVIFEIMMPSIHKIDYLAEKAGALLKISQDEG